MKSTGSPTLTERIVAALTVRIIEGTLQPGTPVRQDRIAEEFGSSHVPVREAFRLLEAEGLLVALPRRGVRVAPLDPSAMMEIVQMRAALECLALQQAASRLTAADLSSARKANSKCAKSRDISVWEKSNREFHMALVKPCAMPRLLATIEDLHRTSARYLFATWKDLDWQPRSIKEHEELVERLEAGDAASAEAILRRHIIDAGDALAARLAK
jgi:DNA-binding GntR family transcriptional regulator